MRSEVEEYQKKRPVMTAGETVLWSGKPKKWAFIVQRSTFLLPIAILWLYVDYQGVREVIQSGDYKDLLFFAFHLMPVWIWLANVITAYRQWKHAEYFATNRRIIVRSGIFAMNETSVYYRQIVNLQVKIGFWDNFFKTGDVIIDDGTVYTGSRGRRQVKYLQLSDMDQPQEVYQRLQNILMDATTEQ